VAREHFKGYRVFDVQRSDRGFSILADEWDRVVDRLGTIDRSLFLRAISRVSHGSTVGSCDMGVWRHLYLNTNFFDVIAAATFPPIPALEPL